MVPTDRISWCCRGWAFPQPTWDATGAAAPQPTQIADHVNGNAQPSGARPQTGDDHAPDGPQPVFLRASGRRNPTIMPAGGGESAYETGPISRAPRGLHRPYNRRSRPIAYHGVVGAGHSRNQPGMRRAPQPRSQSTRQTMLTGMPRPLLCGHVPSAVVTPVRAPTTLRILRGLG
jgi:hypothetical protein